MIGIELFSLQPLRAICVITTALLLAACGPNDGLNEAPSIAIVGVKLIDGSGAQPIDDAVVVIRGDRIFAAGARNVVEPPPGATIIDGVGKYVMPGLIDLHCHYGGGREGLEGQFLLQLAFGVTTARSLGADGPDNIAVIQLAKSGQIDAPRMYTAGSGFSHPTGMPPGAVINRPTTPSEARELVRQLAAAEVDLIKMWVDSTLDGLLEWEFDWNGGQAPIGKISPEIRTALAQEAAKHGIPAVAHIYEEQDVRQLNSVGVQHFVHTVRDTAVDDDFMDWAKRQNLSFAPALSKAQDSWYLAEHSEALDDPGLQKAFGAERIARLQSAEAQSSMLANKQGNQLRNVYARMQQFIQQAIAAGVVIAVGSDSGAGNVAFGWGAHHEMQLLVEAGLTPLQAITAGTANGAWVLEGDNAEFGTIREGQFADLLLLDADPTEDITNTRQIERVMQNGAWIDQ